MFCVRRALNAWWILCSGRINVAWHIWQVIMLARRVLPLVFPLMACEPRMGPSAIPVREANLTDTNVALHHLRICGVVCRCSPIGFVILDVQWFSLLRCIVGLAIFQPKIAAELAFVPSLVFDCVLAMEARVQICGLIVMLCDQSSHKGSDIIRIGFFIVHSHSINSGYRQLGDIVL